MEDYLLFAGILVVGQFTPGPDLLLITRNALAAERAGPALATALGVCAGLVAHTAAAFGGLGLAVQAMPDLQAALSVAGALYLAYLGVQLVRAAWSASAHEGGGGGAGGAVPLAARKAAGLPLPGRRALRDPAGPASG
ncbi:MAG: LysE family transporter [Verrucomicrobiales bacterium]